MIIRKMESYDLEEVAALEGETFSTPWSRQGFADTLTMENVRFLVAVEREHVIGYCGIYLAADEGEITNVAVNEAFRHMGVGNALVLAIEQYAQDNQIKQIVLEVRKSNYGAIHLYQKNGYTEIGERRNFYQKPVEDALVMRNKIG